jgi:hypothetical protein
MIIDAYNNVWKAVEEDSESAYLTGETYSVEMMLEDMENAGVDMAVGCSLGQNVDNEYLSDVMHKYPDRIIGFGQVNPRRGDAVEIVRRCFEEYGLQGLKLHPTLHGYHFTDHPLLDPVFQVCSEYEKTVLVNALDDPFVTPLGIEEIARNFPKVPVLIAHMGTVWNVVEALLVAKRTDNLYLETSSTQLLEVKMAYRDVGPHKIVMGTDWPGSDFELERLKMAKAIPDADDRRLVEGENLKRLLQLD